MAYVYPNVKSKAELKRLLAEGKPVSVSPNGLEPTVDNGRVQLEGPHYPKPHSWYASGIVYGGRLVSIK